MTQEKQLEDKDIATGELNEGRFKVNFGIFKMNMDGVLQEEV